MKAKSDHDPPAEERNLDLQDPPLEASLPQPPLASFPAKSSSSAALPESGITTSGSDGPRRLIPIWLCVILMLLVFAFAIYLVAYAPLAGVLLAVIVVLYFIWWLGSVFSGGPPPKPPIFGGKVWDVLGDWIRRPRL